MLMKPPSNLRPKMELVRLTSLLLGEFEFNMDVYLALVLAGGCSCERHCNRETKTLKKLRRQNIKIDTAFRNWNVNVMTSQVVSDQANVAVKTKQRVFFSQVWRWDSRNLNNLNICQQKTRLFQRTSLRLM